MTHAFRFVTEHAGVVTRHAFSSGAHYDPSLVSHGPVVGCDEHTVEPGAGFGWHAHRGVVIVSWVLEGTLRHEDSDGAVLLVRPGAALVQSTGDGIRHTETNASSETALRFVQTTLLVAADPSVGTATPPVTLPGGATFAIAAAPPVESGLAVPLDDGSVLVVRFAG